MKAKKTKQDVLAKKREELAKYTTKADEAVSLVTSTVDSLSQINESISEKIQEIEEYQSELTKTRDGLSSAREKNARIINNFRALIEG